MKQVSLITEGLYLVEQSFAPNQKAKRERATKDQLMEYDYDYYYGSGSSSSSGELDTQKLCDEIFVIYEKLKASFIL